MYGGTWKKERESRRGRRRSWRPSAHLKEEEEDESPRLIGRGARGGVGTSLGGGEKGVGSAASRSCGGEARRGGARRVVAGSKFGGDLPKKVARGGVLGAGFGWPGSAGT